LFLGLLDILIRSLFCILVLVYRFLLLFVLLLGSRLLRLLGDWRLLCVRILGLYFLVYLGVVGRRLTRTQYLLRGSLLLLWFFLSSFLLGGLLFRRFLLLLGSLGLSSRRFVLERKLLCGE